MITAHSSLQKTIASYFLSSAKIAIREGGQKDCAQSGGSWKEVKMVRPDLPMLTLNALCTLMRSSTRSWFCQSNLVVPKSGYQSLLLQQYRIDFNFSQCITTYKIYCLLKTRISSLYFFWNNDKMHLLVFVCLFFFSTMPHGFMWFEGSQFPNQGLNPGPGSENTESSLLYICSFADSFSIQVITEY